MMREVRRSTYLSLGLALGLAALAVPAAGQSAGRVRVTDPAELAAMGFSADAVVYRTPGAALVQHNGVEPKLSGPDNFGGSVSYTAHPGNAAHGRVSTYAYGSPAGRGDVSFTGGDIFADIQMEMPGGANWDGARYWANDGDGANDMFFFLFRSCLPAFGPGVPDATLFASGSTSGTPGDDSAFISIPSETVDNEACFYWFRVRFDAAGLTLQKARAQWRRQVSPDPAFATFADVPVGNGYHQFVEALFAAGFVAGCGGGNYCPNDPITRGQMAVFLSAALGLQFP